MSIRFYLLLLILGLFSCGQPETGVKLQFLETVDFEKISSLDVYFFNQSSLACPTGTETKVQLNEIYRKKIESVANLKHNSFLWSNTKKQDDGSREISLDGLEAKTMSVFVRVFALSTTGENKVLAGVGCGTGVFNNNAFTPIQITISPL